MTMIHVSKSHVARRHVFVSLLLASACSGGPASGDTEAATATSTQATMGSPTTSTAGEHGPEHRGQHGGEHNGEKAGVTGAIVLAESHLAIHTWPESGDVTLDVYVCNYSRDNSDCAKGLFQTIIAALQPEHVVEKTVTRGEVNTRCRIAA